MTLEASAAQTAAYNNAEQEPGHNRSASCGLESSLSSASGTTLGDTPDAVAEPPPPIQPTASTSGRGDRDYEIPEGRLTETQIALNNALSVDKYGFIRKGSPSPPKFHQRTRSQQNISRTNKWLKMLGPQRVHRRGNTRLEPSACVVPVLPCTDPAQGAHFKAYFTRKPEKVKRRVRKGIPDQLRGLAWQLLSGGKELMTNNPERYQELLDVRDPALEQEIMRDLSRTFPNHVLFSDRQGPGQHSLFQVLRAYSALDRKVGYVQGMGFIAATLLMYMAEEEAFWSLVALMKGASVPGIEGLFLPGMPLLQQCMYQFDHLLADEAPALSQHFRREGVDPSMFCTHWFTTVFSYSMPFEHLLRVWDVFLLEGMKVVFRVGLVLMTGAQQQLGEASFEKLVGALNSKQFPAYSRPPDELIKAAVRISISKRLDELRVRYQSTRQGFNGTS